MPLAGLAGRSMLSAPRLLLRRLGSPEGHSEADLERAAQLADRYAAVLGDMKGAVMKVGQILSFIDAEGLVPDAYQEVFQSALSGLQDDVPPMSAEDARLVFEQEIGSPPERIFTYFSPHPIAAASIGQVHAAHLHDGTELAVKIQYPGAAEAVQADLANAETLTAIVRLGLGAMGKHAPSIDPKVIVSEVRDRIVEELDYRTEAANQSAFARSYQDHPFIRIPTVRDDLSTERVLTMAFVDGRRWPAALASDEELRVSWGEVIFRFVFTSLYRYGLFNADPHPGNYLFHEDGTVTFLDFGCVKRFGSSQLDLLSQVDDAAIENNALRLTELFEELGMLTARDTGQIDAEKLLAYYRLQLRCLWDEQPFAFTPEYAADVVASTYDPVGPWSDVARRITMPKDLVFLNRVVIGLLSILGRLGATADWAGVDAEIRHGAAPTTHLGHLEAIWRDAPTTTH
jgi:predicted unusual protein kinase regulating ubiquinone biosynthesis (AarF/ABC1/UbiB family)